MKNNYYIDRVSKSEAAELLLRFHYLKVKGAEGEWKERSRKHRYVMMFDKNLKLLW